ncbi:alpha/beta hydrolase [Arsenicitalea aurantiaca]|uniref:Palmitoyl-protein thioesterase ABHD10, mitochondrial n=1 Tax=Arsenicitalea aurantiaca TaxID=1783274 RepID=A0A433X8H7_9HYPH|nr:alpha/beta hydrolase [Arsenicitalea aurantiaca]RUT30353.1 alpha/beta hydrolase [Arsenicitalea aurantiaca]
MFDVLHRTIDVGTGPAGRPIATILRNGDNPGLFWLGGYRSDMEGSKALCLDALGARERLMVTRFDYSGHGRSGGDFLEGTISRWLEEALAVFALTEGNQIVIGSSMGGWLALLLARALRQRGENRVRGMVLIAPAVDMTVDLMEAGFTQAEREAMAASGLVLQPSDYSDEPYPITRGLIEDGRRHLLFGKGIEAGCPVTILQGGKDTDVPPAHALKLVSHLLTDPVTLTLIPDGDHRLSRPEDLHRLEQAVLRHREEIGLF